jgi:hypothetical protein
MSHSTPDPFAALGLPVRPDLTDERVRTAWRQVATATHPDRPDGGDPARYAAASAAYAILRTPWGTLGGLRRPDRRAAADRPRRHTCPSSFCLAARWCVAVAGAGPGPDPPWQARPAPGPCRRCCRAWRAGLAQRRGQRASRRPGHRDRRVADTDRARRPGPSAGTLTRCARQDRHGLAWSRWVAPFPGPPTRVSSPQRPSRARAGSRHCVMAQAPPLTVTTPHEDPAPIGERAQPGRRAPAAAPPLRGEKDTSHARTSAPPPICHARTSRISPQFTVLPRQEN